MAENSNGRPKILQSEGFMKLYCNNRSPINIARNPVQHNRTKNIQILQHFIKEKINSGTIACHLCPPTIN